MEKCSEKKFHGTLDFESVEMFDLTLSFDKVAKEMYGKRSHADIDTAGQTYLQFVYEVFPLENTEDKKRKAIWHMGELFSKAVKKGLVRHVVMGCSILTLARVSNSARYMIMIVLTPNEDPDNRGRMNAILNDAPQYFCEEGSLGDVIEL